MNRIVPILLPLVLTAATARPGAAAPPGEPVRPIRPVATYSIVARDAATGQLGVAVQSHWFSVGGVVPWAEAGVGAVATQSMVDPLYGPAGLELMRLGRSAPAALAGLLASDNASALRQVAMIDAAGHVAAHTGARCIAAAGMVVDEKNQFSVQANLMENERVWPAMAAAYVACHGDLVERMLAALDAAESAGGDIRGRQSAALLVVAGKPSGKAWADRLFDLRVEDHPTPLVELRRLVQLQRAYSHMNAGDEAIEKKDFARAGVEYAAAEKLAPQVVEMPFWQAVSLANNGHVDEALPIFRDVFAREPQRWVPLIPRLVQSELLPKDPQVAKKILAEAPK
ncbi:MAG: DUF1028 domain-containing protein [Phycisphaerae bacterium]